MEAIKSITKECCILAALVLATFNVFAAGVASVGLTSQSMKGESHVSDGGTWMIFSTADAAAGLPMHTVGTNGQLITNDEWRPATNGFYETDAAVLPASADPNNVQPSDVLFGGKLRLLFPTNDVDTNGVLDHLQFEIGGDQYITGGGITEYSTNGGHFHTTIPFESAWFTGAGSVGGLAYHWDIIDNGIGLDAQGILHPLYMTGFVTNRGASLVFGLATMSSPIFPDPFGNFRYKGTAAARIRGDELRIGQFNLKRSDGKKIRANKTTLHRVNDKFIGKITFNDWNPATPWPDYKEWAIEIGEFVRPAR